MVKNNSAFQRVALARDSKRPSVTDYIDKLFTDFYPLCGDRLHGEDKSLLGGLAFFHEMPVTVLGHRKGKTLEENLACNFGMPGPEGYRKALRLMEQAEKFQRPLITFIDTPGAYPGIEAEQGGQGEAIARCLHTMSSLTVPVISLVMGEGGSGGALALGVANVILMLENAVYSVISPEGFATILWHDVNKKAEAAEMMKLTAADLYKFGIADEIIGEPPGGVSVDSQAVFDSVDWALAKALFSLSVQKKTAIKEHRYAKYRKICALGGYE